MMQPYYSFLLRLWLAGGAERPLWHVSLENPHTREVLGFDDLETLLAYLLSLTREAGGSCPDAAKAQEWPARQEELSPSGQSE
jgi:hypothetical protein